MGVSSASHAVVMPSITSESCHMICGFSGLPKFRQFVAATGVAPVHETFLADSATACIAPSLGSSQHQRALPSSAIASAREVPLIRMTPASAPGPSTVLVWTMESYCSKIQRLLQMLGEASRRLKVAVRSAPGFAHAVFADDLANGHRVESPLFEDTKHFLLASLFRDQQHALLRFAEHDLVRGH